MKPGKFFFALCLMLICFAEVAYEYPVDGYRESGIRRLERLRIRLAGELTGPLPAEGARKSIRDIRLHLVSMPQERQQQAADLVNDPANLFDLSTGDSVPPVDTLPSPLLRPAETASSLSGALDTFPPPDHDLQRRIENLFKDRHKSYSVAVFDITPGKPPRYAALREKARYSPGSVGKLAIAAGIFSEIQRLYPNFTELRKSLLRTRMIEADQWILYDHHGVPFYNPEDSSVAFRPIREGDVFSLYEWIDHMLSPSSNAAASTVWKEALLMRAFGEAYPPSKETEETFFKNTPKDSLSRMAMSIVNDPLRKLGIPDSDWRLGSFFTRTGKQMVPGYGGSYASPAGLLLFLLRLEQGKVVDEWTSLELKRLMYMTEKRIRYASSPRLAASAVYFKSGSLYRCKKEEGFQCGKYRGNVDNYMNSVAIVEKPEGSVYLVALMSNVLRVNSAVEHQTLATYIDRILSN